MQEKNYKYHKINSSLDKALVDYSMTPRINKEFNITISGVSVDKKHIQKLIWSISNKPKNSTLSMKISTDAKQATLIAKQTGDYALTITHPSGEKIKTEFTIDQELPFDIKKLDNYDKDKNISEISAIVTNQFWIYSETLTPDALKTIVQKLKWAKIIGYDEIQGLLIEGDSTSPHIKTEMKKLLKIKGIDAIDIRIYEGIDFVNAPSKIADDGSLYNDGGDNWHLEYIGVERAWDITTGSDTFFIGVCDSGKYDTNHEDLYGRFRETVSTRNKSDGEHGTQSSGAIIAISDNKKGISGINWTTKAIGIHCSYRTLKSLIKRDKVLLANNSWYMEGGHVEKNFDPRNLDTRPIQESKAFIGSRAYRKLAIKYKIKLFIWAAGNGVGNGGSESGIYGVDGVYGNPSLHYKEKNLLNKCNNVLFVAALSQDEKLVHYSNYGESVDIAAPTGYKSTKIGDDYATDRGRGYGSNLSGGFTGTSAAAPVVTGVASLIYSIDTNFTASDVKLILLKSATKYARYRYTKPDLTTTERLEHKIPILNAESALRMARDIKEGKLMIDRVTKEIKPVVRDFTFDLSPHHSSMTLDEVESSEPFVVKIYADGREISADDYRKFRLSIDVDGINSSLGYDTQGRRTIQLHSDMFLCFSRDEEIKIDITLRRGTLPTDSGSSRVDIKISDMDWEKECRTLFSNVPIIGLSLLYLFGLFHKAKFCRNQRIGEMERLYGTLIAHQRRVSTYLAWWQRLIPYRAERVKYQDMVFIANRRCNAVHIFNTAKSNILINGDASNNRDGAIKVFTGSTIKNNEREYLLS